MRRAFLQISPLFLERFLLKQEPDEWFHVQAELPPDAKFIRTWYDERSDNWMLLFEHESFKEISEGRQYPVLKKLSVTVRRLADES